MTIGHRFLNLVEAGIVTRLPITDGMMDDGASWDSAGNDHAHDGQGVGHQAGDHTGHVSLFRVNDLPALLSDSHGLSVEELLARRKDLLSRA